MRSANHLEEIAEDITKPKNLKHFHAALDISHARFLGVVTIRTIRINAIDVQTFLLLYIVHQIIGRYEKQLEPG